MNPSFLVPLILAMGMSTAAMADGISVTDQTFEYRASDGKKMIWNTSNGTFSTPVGQIRSLTDCSDKLQTCMTDHHGFAFAYFRICDASKFDKLKFSPKIIATLHNELWITFDAAPNYMFHYQVPSGIIGIYKGPAPSFDFRSLLHKRNLQLEKYQSMEFRLVGTEGIASCKPRK